MRCSTETTRLTHRAERRFASRTPTGFTLLEVLLAVVIAAGLFLSIMLFYRQTAETREAVAEQLDAVGSARRIMQHLTTELRAAAHPDTGSSFSGSQQQINFVTTSIPAGSPDQARSTATGLVRVEYALQLDEEQRPLGLTRVEEPIRSPAQTEPDDNDFELRPRDEDDEGAAPRPLVISDQLRFLRFRYWDGEDWTDSWQSETPPAAVQIMLAVIPVPEELNPEEYPEDVFRRTISIGYALPTDPDVAGEFGTSEGGGL